MKQWLCCSRTESFNTCSLFTILPINIRGVWYIGWVDSFVPVGHGFEFRCSHHARDLGLVLHLQFPVFHCINWSTFWACKLWHSVNCCGCECLWVVVDLKRRYRNIKNEWMNAEPVWYENLSGVVSCPENSNINIDGSDKCCNWFS